MDFENKFTVNAPIDEVFRTLLEVDRVAPCVPGAQVLEQTGEDSYKVGIKVKLGPVSQQYKGDVEVVERDEKAHTATMSAKAREARGQGTANARVTMSLTESGGQTHGTIASNVQLSGKAAAMGQRMVKDVSTKLIDTFATNLEAMLAGDSAAGDGAGATAKKPQAPPSDAAGATATAAPPSATPPAAAREPAQPSFSPAAEPEGLSVLPLIGGVISSRLREPRVAGGLGAALLGLLLLRRRRR